MEVLYWLWSEPARSGPSLSNVFEDHAWFCFLRTLDTGIRNFLAQTVCCLARLNFSGFLLRPYLCKRTPVNGNANYMWAQVSSHVNQKMVATDVDGYYRYRRQRQPAPARPNICNILVISHKIQRASKVVSFSVTDLPFVSDCEQIPGTSPCAKRYDFSGDDQLPPATSSDLWALRATGQDMQI